MKMKNKKQTNADKSATDIRFAKSVASDYGHNINDKQAEKAIKICGNDYYEMKNYFLN